MNLNQELVKQGWCWWYRKYAPGDTVLEGQESEAREAKKGLWADLQPVPPWEWRTEVAVTACMVGLLHFHPACRTSHFDN
jgi:endonuclease YncB( thermonuclease family)